MTTQTTTESTEETLTDQQVHQMKANAESIFDWYTTELCNIVLSGVDGTIEGQTVSLELAKRMLWLLHQTS